MKLRHQETQAKKNTKSRRSSLCHFSKFLRTMILDIHQGYLKSPYSGLALSRFYPRVNLRATYWPGLPTVHPGQSPLSSLIRLLNTIQDSICLLPTLGSPGLSSTSWHRSNYQCFWLDLQLQRYVLWLRKSIVSRCKRLLCN